MYRRLLGCVLCCLLMAWLLPSCTKNEFTVTFELPEDVDRTYTLVYYASDPAKGWLVETVVPISRGRGEVKGLTVRPTLVYVLASGGVPQAVFYASRGDRIKIAGKSQNPADWDISGNDLSRDLTAFRQSAAKALELARKDPEKGAEAVNRAVTDYVSKNQENPVSALLLLTMYDRRLDDDGFRQAWKKLRGDAAEAKWQELAARADLVGPFDASTSLPGRMVLKTFETGCDTIVPGRVPALLYFSRGSDGGYRDDMKRLRTLSRDFGDSSRRVIAEISFDTDSASRLMTLRRDSLSKAVHAWMPLGLSDSLARALRVPRTPYVMVLDRKGRTLYRGGDLRRADSLFRQALK